MSGSLGIHIQRRRITDMLQYIDPVGRSQRWHSVVRRSVPGPNSLWHIDGHHRLMVIIVLFIGGLQSTVV